ncbi:hypothetical protein DL764_006288 [Monosporascus ibericus]|uniref:Mid2 domain-containing protein n=1 Tax=Monosporascus ibericus TaxID=155417 RepID=A0A4Q4T563_9PEZI|nr:hypothetical protein DL764_006288 [Monosporascus ibericus]
MASLVRLTALGCAIATVNARWFESSDDARSRNPALETGQNADPDPPRWTPKPTPAPGSSNIGLELRQDSDYSIATCATRFMSTWHGTHEHPITCRRGSFCSADEENERVGCCIPSPETTGLAPSTTSLSSSSSSEAPPTITVTVEPSIPSSVAQAAGGSNSSKTGAIVGGVVGGLGGIALIAAVIFFLYRRKKRAKAATPPDYITPLGPTYYPGPEDPPLHPNQYGSSSQPVAQATQHDAPGTGYLPVSYPPATAVPADRYVNRAPSPYYPMSPKTAEDDAAVSPIESTSSVSPPDSPQSPYARALSPTMPPVQYNRFSPPPPQQFQAYRPYPGT